MLSVSLVSPTTFGNEPVELPINVEADSATSSLPPPTGVAPPTVDGEGGFSGNSGGTTQEVDSQLILGYFATKQPAWGLGIWEICRAHADQFPWLVELLVIVENVGAGARTGVCVEVVRLPSWTAKVPDMRSRIMVRLRGDNRNRCRKGRRADSSFF